MSKKTVQDKSKPKPEPELETETETETETDVGPELDSETEIDQVSENAENQASEGEETEIESTHEPEQEQEQEPEQEVEAEPEPEQEQDDLVEIDIEPKNDDTEVMTFKSTKEDDDCFYEPNEIIIDDFETEQTERYITEGKITKPYLTKYERTCLLSNRVQQLSLGAKPMIKNYTGLSPNEIAKLEIKHKVIPLIILRPLPGNIIERWYITEFINI